MAVKQVTTQEGINPQIIPMIDIMFLLLLFMMVGADMGQAELEEVRLPEADLVKDEEGEPPLTVNCYHVSERELACALYARADVCAEEPHWKIGIRERDDIRPQDLAAVLEPFAAEKRFDAEHPRRSEKPVHVRADASALYGHVQAVIAACSEVGIYKLEVGAAARP